MAQINPTDSEYLILKDELKTESNKQQYLLPIEYSFKQCIAIYLKRSGIIFLMAVANMLMWTLWSLIVYLIKYL